MWYLFIVIHVFKHHFNVRFKFGELLFSFFFFTFFPSHSNEAGGEYDAPDPRNRAGDESQQYVAMATDGRYKGNYASDPYFAVATNGRFKENNASDAGMTYDNVDSQQYEAMTTDGRCKGNPASNIGMVYEDVD